MSVDSVYGKFSIVDIATPLFAYALGVYTYSSGAYYEDLWSLKISDGGTQTKLVDYSALSNNEVASPRFSPDYSQVCFINFLVSGTEDLCVVNADGTGLTVLDTQAIINDAPQWHPGGQQVYYRIANSVYRIDVTGANKTLIISVGAGSRGWGFNHDASLMAYINAAGSLVVANSDGSSPTTIVASGATSGSYDDSVVWSRTSNVLFYRNGTDWRKINSDGTGDTTIDATRQGYIGRYAMSSTNTIIFYVDTTVFASWELWQMPVSGSGATAVSPTRNPFRNVNYPVSVAENRIFVMDNTTNNIWSVLEDGSDYRIDVLALIGPPVEEYPAF